MPISITRESLRPYAVGGLGWVHASSNETSICSYGEQRLPRPSHRRQRHGLLSDVTGLRFDLRYLKRDVLGRRLGAESRRAPRWLLAATVGVMLR